MLLAEGPSVREREGGEESYQTQQGPSIPWDRPVLSHGSIARKIGPRPWRQSGYPADITRQITWGFRENSNDNRKMTILEVTLINYPFFPLRLKEQFPAPGGLQS